MVKSQKIKRTPGDQAVQVLIYVIVGLFALVTVLPFLYVVAGSFATERELTERAFFIIPSEFSLNAYQYLLKTGDVFKGLKNSLIVTVVGTFSICFSAVHWHIPFPGNISAEEISLPIWLS